MAADGVEEKTEGKKESPDPPPPETQTAPEAKPAEPEPFFPAPIKRGEQAADAKPENPVNVNVNVPVPVPVPVPEAKLDAKDTKPEEKPAEIKSAPKVE